MEFVEDFMGSSDSKNCQGFIKCHGVPEIFRDFIDVHITNIQEIFMKFHRIERIFAIIQRILSDYFVIL